MRLFVAVTDNDWFKLHASKTAVEEVNFWRPSPNVSFKRLVPGELLLFKLKGPNDSIAGGGFAKARIPFIDGRRLFVSGVCGNLWRIFSAAKSTLRWLSTDWS
jgi:hypothetical protein